MSSVLDVIMWLIIASLVVLVIMNPSGFSQDVSALGNYSIGQTTILTGSGYKKAS